MPESGGDRVYQLGLARYDKFARNYFSGVLLAAATIWSTN
jgi:hypothetical protein